MATTSICPDCGYRYTLENAWRVLCLLGQNNFLHSSLTDCEGGQCEDDMRFRCLGCDAVIWSDDPRYDEVDP